MSTDIATQIRARLDAIASERLRLDDEERRLRKALEALEALEPTTPVEPEVPGLDEAIQRQTVPMSPRLPSMPYPVPHYPPPSWDRWVIPEGPQIDMGPNHLVVQTIGTTLPFYEVDGFHYYAPTTASVDAGSLHAYGHNQD
ncbi:hypothetical protein WMF38_57595 [Sorangium sp. So ce118]